MYITCALHADIIIMLCSSLICFTDAYVQGQVTFDENGDRNYRKIKVLQCRQSGDGKPLLAL